MIKTLIFLISLYPYYPEYIGNKYYIKENLYNHHDNPVISSVGYHLDNEENLSKRLVWIDFTTESVVRESNYTNFMQDGFLHTIEIQLPPLIYTTCYNKIYWRYQIDLYNWTTDLQMKSWSTDMSFEVYDE